MTVQIDSILSLSKGATIGTSHWEAVLETQVVPPTSDDSILSNPLGLYVTRLSWTEQRS